MTTVPVGNESVRTITDAQRAEIAARELRELDAEIAVIEARPWYSKLWDKITGS